MEEKTKDGKGVGRLAIIGIIVVVALVALGTYGWLTSSKHQNQGSSTLVTEQLFTNRTVTLAGMLGNMTEGFDTNQFQVSYTGNATADLYGLRISVPVNLSVARYYNDSRVYGVVSGIPLIGNLTILDIKNGSRYYSCDLNVNNSVRSYECHQEDASNSLFSSYNFSNGRGHGFGEVMVHLSHLNVSSYRGMPCTNVFGRLNYSNSTELSKINTTAETGQQVSSVNMTFLSCVSNSDRIPLTLNMVVAAGNSTKTITVGLQLSETSFSRSSSPSIAELPGPVVNSTGFGQSG
ncbi:MAG: hypothetical protein KGH94_00485 [Candidatus Micrarchaeota archaeon]|nr:hypothetical protein [Candidatus Micrarchaeota archaeon]